MRETVHAHGGVLWEGPFWRHQNTVWIHVHSHVYVHAKTLLAQFSLHVEPKRLQHYSLSDELSLHWQAQINIPILAAPTRSLRCAKAKSMVALIPIGLKNHAFFASVEWG